MQKLQIFSVWDKKVAAYFRPFYSPNTAAAVRALEDDVNNPETPMAKHPGDYALYLLGEFDDASGVITPKQMPVLIEEAQNLKIEKK